MKLAIQCAVSLALICTVGSLSIGRKQSAGAKGRLLCDGKPEKKVLVKVGI
jgi:hypothetical protein